MKRRSLELLLWGVVAFWGANYTVGKWGMLGFSPLNFTLIRFLLTTPLLMLMLYILEHDLKVKVHDLPQMALIGLIGTTLYQTVFMSAVKYASATNASLLLAASPVFTALFSWGLKQERLSVRGRWGSLLSLIGVTLVLLFGHAQLVWGSEALLGNGYALLASALWGLYPISAHNTLQKYSALKTVTFSSFFGMFFLLVVGTPGLVTMSWQAIPWQAWAALVYAIGPVTAFGLVAWFYGISKVGGNRVMMYMYAIPVAAIVTAALLLGERIHLMQIVGAGVIFTGIHIIKSGKADPAVAKAGTVS